MNNKRQYPFTFNQLDEIETALGTAEDKIQKAAALNGAVLTNYLSSKAPDRDKAAYLTFTYGTWQKLIECVSDILDDAEAALSTASAALHREWD